MIEADVADHLLQPVAVVEAAARRHAGHVGQIESGFQRGGVQCQRAVPPDDQRSGVLGVHDQRRRHVGGAVNFERLPRRRGAVPVRGGDQIAVEDQAGAADAAQPRLGMPPPGLRMIRPRSTPAPSRRGRRVEVGDRHLIGLRRLVAAVVDLAAHLTQTVLENFGFIVQSRTPTVTSRSCG